MAFAKEDFKELDLLFVSHFSQQEKRLRKIIREEIDEIKERLDRLFNMESENIHVAYTEIKDLKKRVAKLERLLAK